MRWVLLFPTVSNHGKQGPKVKWLARSHIVRAGRRGHWSNNAAVQSQTSIPLPMERPMITTPMVDSHARLSPSSYHMKDSYSDKEPVCSVTGKTSYEQSQNKFLNIENK